MKIGKKKLQSMADEWKGNWMKWRSFCWLLDRPEDSANWCIIETCHRDSPIKDLSNGRYFHKHMNPLVDDTKDVIEWGSSHWADGSTDGRAVRVGGEDSKPTKAFAVQAGLLCERELTDILDPKDYAERVEEGKRKNIEFYSHNCLPDGCSLKDEKPDNWAERVLDRLLEIDDSWEDDLDDDGTSRPPIDGLVQALEELGLLEREAA